MERGCITGIIGSNGSGKTTFLRALCHDIPFSGTMTMDGEDFSQAGLHRRSRLLALVPQQVEKIALSVFDYVLMGRTPYRKWYQTDYTAFWPEGPPPATLRPRDPGLQRLPPLRP